VALRRIAAAAHAPRRAPGPNIDREALLRSLDMIIARLRSGLNSPNSTLPSTE
jgi:hypothetical protein